ncbi:hypothetical protein B296_00009262 [Ensete ventricosum]|uniref:Exostosin GT47 domain-containing protein n=1 Tax=Ensete ventricosum TaxID=4639 RepID=A0A427AQR8_ENSVE|nr:hypothetical protein B296_00009262 [Ensete ventricosum]
MRRFATALVLISLCFFVVFPSSRALRVRPRLLERFARPGNRAQAYQYEERYFRQSLDHFSFADLPPFDQRYLIANTGAWARPAGPIFFYCGNEGDIEWFAANTGFVWDIAPRFSALVVFAEVTTATPFLALTRHRNLNNTEQLSDWLSSAYSYLAMVDYPYPSDFMMPLPANPIKEVS